MFAKLSNNRKLEEATSTKDDVAPMYLLDEIAGLAGSGGEVAQGMADTTIRRLGHRSPVVKLKALKLIKHVSNKGAHDYRRAIVKQAKEIRQLTSYRGDPDPFKGDVPNQRVRDAAREALDAVFQAQDMSYQPMQAPKLTNRIQGFGSSGEGKAAVNGSGSGYSGPSGGFGDSTPAGSSSSASGMVGFGNPRYEGGGGGSGGGGGGSKWLPPSLSNKLDNLNVLPKAPKTTAAGRGMRNDDVHGGYSSDEQESHNGSYSRPQLASAPQASPLGPRTSAAASPSGRDEVALVDDLCAPRGMRAQPDRDDLKQFVETAASMNGRLIAERLQAKMEAGSWQEVLRALCALEAVVQQGSTAACGEIAVHFQAHPEPVRQAQQSPQSSVKQRAGRVLQLIGGDTLPPAGSSAAPPASGAAAPDLMGGFLDDGAGPAPAAPSGAVPDLMGDLLGEPPAAAPQAGAMGGMFAGLTVDAVQPGAQHQHQQQADGLPQRQGGFAGGSAMPGHPQGAQHAGQSPLDLLGGLGQPAPQQQAAHANAGSGLSDMFGGLSLGIPAAAVAAGSSMDHREGPHQSPMIPAGGQRLGQQAGLPAGQRAHQQPAQAVQTGGAGLDDIFGGLALGGSPAPQQQHQAPPAAQPAPAGAARIPVDDSFSSLGSSQPQAWPHSMQQQSAAMGFAPDSQAAAPQQQQYGAGGAGPGGFNFAHMLLAGQQQYMGQQPGMSMAPPGSQQMPQFPQGMPFMPGMVPGMGGPNPMAGLPGIPPAQMQYLQRQFHQMAGQGLGGMPPMAGGMAPPSPAAGYPNFSGGQPGSNGTGQVLRTGSQASSGGLQEAGGSGKTDLLGRAISTSKQDSFDFVGDHITNLKGKAIP